MTIIIQLKSFLFSFLFGGFFSFLLHFNYKYIYKGPLILKILINLVFVFDNVLLYFVIIKKINNGIIHNYFILMILLGFVMMEWIFKKFLIVLKIKE